MAVRQNGGGGGGGGAERDGDGVAEGAVHVGEPGRQRRRERQAPPAAGARRVPQGSGARSAASSGVTAVRQPGRTDDEASSLGEGFGAAGEQLFF